MTVVQTFFNQILYIRKHYQILEDELPLFNIIYNDLKKQTNERYSAFDNGMNVKKMIINFHKIIENVYYDKYNFYETKKHKDELIIFFESFNYRKPKIYSIENANDILKIKADMLYIIRNEKINKLLK